MRILIATVTAGGGHLAAAAALDEAWRTLPLRGSWFIEAFEGPMSNLQRVIAGEDAILVSSVDDALKTMAIVEACYESSEGGAIPIPNA